MRLAMTIAPGAERLTANLPTLGVEVVPADQAAVALIVGPPPLSPTLPTIAVTDAPVTDAGGLVGLHPAHATAQSIVARARALVGPADDRVRLRGCLVHLPARLALWADRDERLTGREVELLTYLSNHAGMLIDRGRLLEDVWGMRADTNTRTVDSTISRLRAKIEVDPKAPYHLQTRYGAGVRLTLLDDRPTRLTTIPHTDGPDLVGREQILDDLRAKLVPGAVISLIGPPGAGKSRLGLEIARSWHGEAIHVDLSGVSGLEHAIGLVARALGIGPAGDVAAALAARSDLVLVLDGATLDDKGLGPQLAAWAGTGARILSVGRRMGVVVQVPALEADDALEMYRQIARRRAPGVQLDEERAKALLDRLEGLPLAIELAAMRFPTLGPDELLERFDARFDLLRSSDKTGHHHTLRAALEAAWEQLASAHRQMLAALSILPGAFDISWAQDLTNRDPVDELDELFDVGLLLRGDRPGEFRMLAAIRDFAADKRASLDPDGEVPRRLAGAVLARTASPTHDHTEERLCDIGWIALDAFPEDETLRQAMFELAERLNRWHDILRAAGKEPPPTPELEGWQASALARTGRAHEATPRLRRLVAQHPDNPRFLGWLGSALALAGQHDEAIEILGRTRILVPGSARITGNLGTCLQWTGRLLEAESVLEEANDLARASGDPRNEAWTAQNLGVVLGRRGYTERAAQRFRAAEGKGHIVTQAVLRGNIGVCEAVFGNWDRACALLEDSVVTLRRAGRPTYEIELGLTWALAEAGRHGHAAAERLLDSLRLVLRDVDHHPLRGRYGVVRALCRALAGDDNAARDGARQVTPKDPHFLRVKAVLLAILGVTPASPDWPEPADPAVADLQRLWTAAVSGGGKPGPVPITTVEARLLHRLSDPQCSPDPS